jgi:Fe-S cluster biosynthesis and repair protein YggX
MTTTPSLDERIQRFEYMATADPDNDMAHFSLGTAYLQAGRAAEAAASLEKCVSINADMSKAYQLAGQAMIDAGWEDKAAEILLKGYEVAGSKGDRMPQTAIAELLERIGRPIPELSAEARATAEAIESAGTFVCRRSGRPGNQLEDVPFRGPVGAWIRENISAETWHDWIGQGTKVINELRLDLSREEDQHVFDQQMYEFLGIDEETLATIRGGA